MGYSEIMATRATVKGRLSDVIAVVDRRSRAINTNYTHAREYICVLVRRVSRTAQLTQLN